MLDGIIYGLIVAWILAIFNVDSICINVLQPFFTNVKLTTDHYYFCIWCVWLNRRNNVT